MGYRHQHNPALPPLARRRRPGFDSGFSGGPGFGFDAVEFAFGPRGRRGGPGARARRGDVRVAILGLLGEKPASGYGLIQLFHERTDGAWRPSPGSIYPTLQQLVDEGLVVAAGGSGRSSEYALSDEGRAWVDAHADEVAQVWTTAGARAGGQSEFAPYRESAAKLARAMGQFAHEATPAQRAAAVEKFDELRKTLYGILAD